MFLFFENGSRTIWRFSKMWIPSNHPFIDGFSIINHPAILVSDETLLLSTWHAVTFSTFLQTTLPDRWGFHRPSGAFSWHQVKDTKCQGKALPMMFELSACPQIGCAIPTFVATLAATSCHYKCCLSKPVVYNTHHVMFLSTCATKVTF